MKNKKQGMPAERQNRSATDTEFPEWQREVLEEMLHEAELARIDDFLEALADEVTDSEPSHW